MTAVSPDPFGMPFLEGLTVGEFRLLSDISFREIILDRQNADAILDHAELCRKTADKFQSRDINIARRLRKRADGWVDFVDRM